MVLILLGTLGLNAFYNLTLVIILIIAVIGRTLITKVMGDVVVRYLRLSQIVVRIILGSLSDRDSNPARD